MRQASRQFDPSQPSNACRMLLGTEEETADALNPETTAVSAACSLGKFVKDRDESDGADDGKSVHPGVRIVFAS